MDFSKYIQYKSKGIEEKEVIEVLNQFDCDVDIVNEILELLNEKTLNYLLFYKQKDKKTPQIVDIFEQMNIKLDGKEKIMSLRSGTYTKITFNII